MNVDFDVVFSTLTILVKSDEDQEQSLTRQKEQSFGETDRKPNVEESSRRLYSKTRRYHREVADDDKHHV